MIMEDERALHLTVTWLPHLLNDKSRRTFSGLPGQYVN